MTSPAEVNPEVHDYLTQFLRAVFGESVWDDSPEKTAERWMKAMTEFAPEPEIDFTFTTFPATVNQLVTVCNIEFASICAHHLFPFSGRVHVGYIPNQLMVGLSKIPRTVHHLAHRPRTQETLTADIASFLKKRLQAHGVAVVVESTHTCMSCRGVQEHNGVMVTTEMRGVFLTAEAARAEFLSVVQMNRMVGR